MKLYTQTYGGNLHESAITINKLGLAEHVIVMDVVGMYTTVVFKMPDELAYKLREDDNISRNKNLLKLKEGKK